MAIFLGNAEPQWPISTYPSAVFPHYGSRGYLYNSVTWPAFSNDDAAGAALKITWTSDLITKIDYYNATGTAITTGVWDGGFNSTEVTDANVLTHPFMDESDAKLYFLAINTDLSPHRYKLCNIDKAGTIHQSFAWTTPSGTSFNNPVYYYNGYLQRVSTDGNFFFANVWADIGEATGASQPHRGVKMTFAASDGALTEAHLMEPANFGAGSEPFYGGFIGPTSNNIYAGLRGTTALNETLHGTIFNATTGVGLYRRWPGSDQTAYPWDMMSQNYNFMHWRGSLMAIAKGTYAGGAFFWDITAMNSFWDEVAVKNGIL